MGYGSLSAMRISVWLSIFCLWPAVAAADEISSSYSRFDLEKGCKQIEPGDEYVYAGTWRCPGHKGIDIVIASSDDRDYVGFGKDGGETCAFKKTFNAFNTALSPVEWRLRNGKVFAAIERWRVVIDENGNTATWLVVSKVDGAEACAVIYVAGSYPDANAVARIMADGEAGDFNCETDVPTVTSTAGPPDITLASCRELMGE